ncbi:hypothetical protein PIROE2DRAFT_63250 [Piromyces sp. E2]|nr:hypothetical protein PIROE2DRAFT_63250 [Piromyces sp. E2]|eukprot:OUM60281.1 hypothetical protein PIROE2DRAFT_63250 [Piromyces sp. E2]
MDITYSTTLSNSYPLAYNRSPFSILTSAFTSFYSASEAIHQPLIPSLDGIWIGTFGHHGLEFIYIKSLNTDSNSSKKDSLITLHNGELPIMINDDEYLSDEDEQAPSSDHFNEIDSTELSDIKKENKTLVAYKITGDVNIPKGEISWSAELNHQIDGEITTLEGRTYDITRSIEFQNAKIYKVEGVVAQIGYRDIKKQPGKLIVLSNDEIAIFWETLYRVSRFKRYL